MSSNEDDPFFKSFQALKSIVTPSKRHTASSSQQQETTTASLQTDLMQQAQQRQALDDELCRAIQAQKATQSALDATSQRTKQIQHDCAVLQQEMQTERELHTAAIQHEHEQCQQAGQAKARAQETLDKVEARSASLELYTAELQGALQQTEQRIQQVQEDNERNRQTQQKTTEELQADLTEVSCQCGLLDFFCMKGRLTVSLYFAHCCSHLFFHRQRPD